MVFKEISTSTRRKKGRKRGRRELDLDHPHQNRREEGARVTHAPPTKEILSLFLPLTAPLIADLPKFDKETAKSTRLAVHLRHAPPRERRVRCTASVFGSVASDLHVSGLFWAFDYEVGFFLI